MNALTPLAQDGASPTRQTIMVLLIDDQFVIGEAVRRSLCDQPDLEFHFCSDAHQALEMAERIQPTVILQDLVMPGVNGLDLVKRFRAAPQTSQIPIIVLSTKEEAAVKSEAFRLGANDYLVKLPEAIELVARIRYHSSAYLAQLQRDEAYRALRRSQQELMETNLELQRLTNVDGLTGLSNRRFLDEILASEWKHASRVGSPISVLMIDVDHFKLYNDHYGHLAGDEVLRRLASTIGRTRRRTGDVAARFGGEEFALVFPLMTGGDALTAGQRLTAAVEAMQLPHAGSTTSNWITVSVGLATVRPQDASGSDALLAAADRALYEAKRSGRNRAVAAHPVSADAARPA